MSRRALLSGRDLGRCRGGASALGRRAPAHHRLPRQLLQQQQQQQQNARRRLELAAVSAEGDSDGALLPAAGLDEGVDRAVK